MREHLLATHLEYKCTVVVIMYVVVIFTTCLLVNCDVTVVIVVKQKQQVISVQSMIYPWYFVANMSPRCIIADVMPYQSTSLSTSPAQSTIAHGNFIIHAATQQLLSIVSLYLSSRLLQSAFNPGIKDDQGHVCDSIVSRRCIRWHTCSAWDALVLAASRTNSKRVQKGCYSLDDEAVKRRSS